MLISKPVGVELVATNVTDTTQTYNETSTYTDNELVQLDRIIYSVITTNTSDQFPTFSNQGDYDIDDIVWHDSVLYKAIKQSYASPSTAGENIKKAWDDIYGTGTTLYGTNELYVAYGTFDGDGTVIDATKIGDDRCVKFTYTLQADGTYDVLEEKYHNSPTYTVDSFQNYFITIEPELSLAYPKDTYFLYNGTLYRSIVADPSIRIPTGMDFTLDGVTIPATWTVVNAADYFENALTYVSPIVPDLPFDSKQYTVATKAGDQTYTIKPLGLFDTLAIGHLKGDTVTAVFKNSTGTIIKTVPSFPIDGKVDADGRHPETHTTMILYAEQDIEANGTIDITIAGAYTEVGMFKAGLSIGTGLTNLVIKNGGRDFSPKEQDKFGNIDYNEGIKIMVHKASFDAPITSYDMMARFIRDFLGSLMIINGSDSKNQAADSQGIFSSTQLIARITSMDQATKVKDGDIDKMVTIPFTCEEIV